MGRFVYGRRSRTKCLRQIVVIIQGVKVFEEKTVGVLTQTNSMFHGFDFWTCLPKQIEV